MAPKEKGHTLAFAPSESHSPDSEEQIWGINAVREALAESPKLIGEVLVQRGKAGQRIQEVIDLARHHGIRVRFVESARLGVPKSATHQGISARIAAAPSLSLEDLLQELAVEKVPVLALDLIQDPRNLGSILRASLAAGFRHVLLTRERSAPLTGTVARTSAGAVAHLRLCQVANMADALRRLQECGYWTYGAVVEPEVQSVYATDFSGAVCLVVGSESKGIRPLVQKRCDHLITIPMASEFNSLNVSVAAGILMFEIRRQLGP